MGKLSDALEKYREDKKIDDKELYVQPPDLPVSEFKPAELPHQNFTGSYFSNPKLITASAPDSLDAENFKILRAQVLFNKDRKRPKTIMVTSAFPGEGKTYIASNLAVSIALGIDEHVLLIDCDMRRPSIHKMFGCSNSVGLHEFLTNKKSLPELIIRTEIPKLSILPAGNSPKNPAELLSSSTMADLIEEVRGRYQDRYIIFDSTPLRATAEAGVLAELMDGIIFVIRSNKAPKQVIQKAIDGLNKDNILGIVFNGYQQAYNQYKRYYKKYYQ